MRGPRPVRRQDASATTNVASRLTQRCIDDPAPSPWRSARPLRSIGRARWSIESRRSRPMRTARRSRRIAPQRLRRRCRPWRPRSPSRRARRAPAPSTHRRRRAVAPTWAPGPIDGVAHDGARRRPRRPGGARCPRRTAPAATRASAPMAHVARRSSRRARRRPSARSTAPRTRSPERSAGEHVVVRLQVLLRRAEVHPVRTRSTNPNTGVAGAITSREDLPLDRDLAIGRPRAQHGRVDQVRARVHVAGDRLLRLLPEGAAPGRPAVVSTRPNARASSTWCSAIVTPAECAPWNARIARQVEVGAGCRRSARRTARRPVGRAYSRSRRRCRAARARSPT